MAWGILVYDTRDIEKNQFFIRHMQECGKEQNLSLTLYEKCQLKMVISQGNKRLWSEKEKKYILPEFVINRSRDAQLSRHIEDMQIPVFNCSEVTQLGNDKWKMLQFIQNNTKLPCIPTVFFQNGDSVDMDELSRIFQENEDKEQQYIVKSIHGHGGKQVLCMPLSSEQEIRQLMKTSPVIVQPRIPGRPRDVRVYILGGQIYHAMERRAAKNSSDWRSNYSLGGECQTIELKAEEKDMVQEITGLLPIAMAGLDFIIDEKGRWLFNEMEDVAGTRMLYQHTHKDIIQDYIKWMVKELMIKDLRNKEDMV